MYYLTLKLCILFFLHTSRHSGRESPCVLFHIPDGSTAGMMNQGKDKKTTTGGGSNSSATARVGHQFCFFRSFMRLLWVFVSVDGC